MTYDASVPAALQGVKGTARVAWLYDVLRLPLGQIDHGAWGAEVTVSSLVRMNVCVHVPDTVHLFAMLIDECGNGIWRAEFLVDFEKAIIPFLQLTRRLPR